MERVTVLIRQASNALCYVSQVLGVLLLLLISSEVFLRSVFSSSLLLTLELSSWLLIAIVFLGSPWTLSNEGHVQIKLFYSRLSFGGQRITSICLSIVGALAIGFFTYYAYSAVIETYLGGIMGDSVYRLPKWWPWITVAIGSTIVCGEMLRMFVHNVKAHDKKLMSIKDLIPSTVICTICCLFFICYAFFAPFSVTRVDFKMGVIVIILFSLIGSGLWIFLSLGLTGVFALMLFTPYPVGEIVAQVAFSANQSFVMTCLPLFIFMGELLFLSGATSRLYSAVAPWVERIPGRLLHSNILSCTVFAAISGSSAVTVATIGSVAVPELKKLGYDRNITLGSLAGAGTLGLIIPPSIPMIVYGAATEESIGQLFAAGIVPGLMISGMMMIYIGFYAIRNPRISPESQKLEVKKKISQTLQIIPIFGLIAAVLGLIYTGITTPTEAGAIGSLGAIAITVVYQEVTSGKMIKAAMATIRTTCMIMFILTGAAILSSSLAYLKIPQELSTYIVSLGLSKYLILSIICLIYLFLGCFFDGISMMVLTLPVVYPLIRGLGFDGIWFGVVLIILIEIAQITPPVGFNLYVLQNISGCDLNIIVKSTIPFFLILVLAVVITIIFPDIALFLPKAMVR